MAYTKTKVWMPITDTRRYLKLGPYAAMAILEDEEGNVIIRHRDYPHTTDIECADIAEATKKFKCLAAHYKGGKVHGYMGQHLHR